MTPANMAMLEYVNLDENRIDYSSSPTVPEPPDYYTDVPLPGHSWVCRMYVQGKSSRLKDMGWPDPAHLVERLCWTETNEPHGVLQVSDPDDATADPYILDSRFSYIYRVASPPPGYRWVAVQVAGTMPIRWENLT